MTWEKRELFAFVRNVMGYMVPVTLDKSDGLVVTGGLCVKGISVPVTMRFYPCWRKAPPRIQCDELWLKRDKDWHCYEDGELCWAHSREWRVFFEYQEHWVKHAAMYFLRNAHYLLEKHVIAEIYGLEEWLPEWDAYLHGIQANEQLLRWEDEFRKSKAAA